MAETNWIRQTEMAKLHGTTAASVTNWIKRGKIKWKIEPKFGIKLVDKTSLTVAPRKKRVKSN